MLSASLSAFLTPQIDVDVKVDSLTKLQAEFETGNVKVLFSYDDFSIYSYPRLPLPDIGPRCNY